MGFGGGEEDLELGWIWEGALGEVFGAAAFTGKLFESFAEGGAHVWGQIRGAGCDYVAGFAAGQEGEYVFFCREFCG